MQLWLICDIYSSLPLRTKTAIAKPFLTFDQKNKSMLKSGIPDMIQEKKFYWFIDPLISIELRKINVD